MKVKTIYDPILRRPARPVGVFDDNLKKTAAIMTEVMRRHDGIGLAANQIGLDQRLIVLEYRPREDGDSHDEIALMQLANPEIVKKSAETAVMTEGCLSVPGLELPVERAVSLVVKARRLDGKAVKIKAKGLLSRILQHEIDHLNGCLFTDRAAGVDQIRNYTWAKIAYFGSDDFSVVILRSLLEAGLNVISVITEPAKPAGRGNKLSSTAVELLAKKENLAVFTPSDKREITAVISQLKPDLIVLASYGRILPAQTLAVPTFGSLNVHPSLLPKFRGATPIQSAILNGERETGVTIMLMDEGIDTGKIVAQTKTPIEATDGALSLRHTLANEGATLLLKTLPRFLSGTAKLADQDQASASQTHKLDKSQAEIDWGEPLELIDRKIRAFQGWPGAFTYLGGKRLKLLGSFIEGDRLHLTQVQLEGKKAVNWADFKRGYLAQLKKTTWFSRIV